MTGLSKYTLMLLRLKSLTVEKRACSIGNERKQEGACGDE